MLHTHSPTQIHTHTHTHTHIPPHTHTHTHTHTHSDSHMHISCPGKRQSLKWGAGRARDGSREPWPRASEPDPELLWPQFYEKRESHLLSPRKAMRGDRGEDDHWDLCGPGTWQGTVRTVREAWPPVTGSHCLPQGTPGWLRVQRPGAGSRRAWAESGLALTSPLCGSSSPGCFNRKGSLRGKHHC